VPRWKTKITIDTTVAEIHGLPSPGRNVNRIIQSLTLLPAETSYKSVYRDFIAGLENDSSLKLLKYDAFRKLWHQVTPYIQIMISNIRFMKSTCFVSKSSIVVVDRTFDIVVFILR